MRRKTCYPPGRWGISRQQNARFRLRDRPERLLTFAIFCLSLVVLSFFSVGVLLVFLSRSISCSTGSDGSGKNPPTTFICLLPSAATPTTLTPATPIPGTSVTVPPRQTPTPKPIPTVTPTPTPPITITPDNQLVLKRVNKYMPYVIEGSYYLPYDFLSPDFQSSVSYADFIKNKNYVLWKACWQIGNEHVSERNSVTWDVGVELAQTSCSDGSIIATFLWHFQLQEQDGLFEITSIGLYPTGVGNQ